MSSKAITDKSPEPGTDAPKLPPDPLAPAALFGPSDLRDDEPALPRAVGMIGAAFVIFGGMALAFHLTGKAVRVGQGWSMLVLVVGMCGLLFHAAFDRDVQFRRLYGIFAAVSLLVGAILALYPHPAVGGQFRWAVPFLFVALLFALAFLRNEDDLQLREIAQYALGGAGLVMAATGLFGGALVVNFGLSYGVMLAVLGLLFVTAFIVSRGISDDKAYYAALLLVAGGASVALFGLGKGLLGAAGMGYFTTFGSVLLTIGVLYIVVGGGLASDSSFAVLTRRELGAFFFSPLAYLALLGFVFISWFSYYLFLDQLLQTDARPLPEPIVQGYFFALFPVFATIVVVPMLTMRLLSEEQRSGTLEVLLTAPIDEVTVVASKFTGGLINFLVMWVPFYLFLLAIPLSGGEPFDYRPLISFGIALIVTGTAFIAGGLFFSSVTNSQIASGVLTGAYMMFLTMLYFPARQLTDTNWKAVLQHGSYLHLWGQSLEGILIPKYPLFYLSLAVLFLFLTVKVLESRKWR